MTREQLIFKKRDLQRQMEELKQSADAIDKVLALFPEETPQNLPGMSVGRYADSTVPDAIIDILSETPGHFARVSDIAAALKNEGIKSSSPNFNTIIHATCNRLAKSKKGKAAKLLRKKKNGRYAFAVNAGTNGAEKQ